MSHKWTKKERDVAAGDVVLLAEAENDEPTYRMGIVDSVKPGEDGHERTVNIRYTNPGKEPGERSPPKITTRPIHKIAVIVPVDYMFEDDLGSKTNGVELPGWRKQVQTTMKRTRQRRQTKVPSSRGLPRRPRRERRQCSCQ